MSIPIQLKDSPLISDWLTFDFDQHITVLTGRVELGQGNLTALLQIAAEELDAPIKFMSILGGDTTRTPNEGFTSGSLSIVQSGMAIRWAASAARHLLLKHAQPLLQKPLDMLSIIEGVVQQNDKPTLLSIWELAKKVNFDVPVVDHASPKPHHERRLVGTSVPRVDLVDRIMGSPFVHDLKFDGLLYGRPVHPPSMSCVLEKIDMAQLRMRPGVVKAIRDGSFVGVIAQNEVDAIAAANWAHKNATWRSIPTSNLDPIKEIELSDEASEIVHTTGNLEAVKGKVFSTTVSRPYLSHGSIGPSAAVAQWQDGKLKVWSHTQGVFPLQSALAMVFGIPVNSIEVFHRAGSGCYGHNGADDVALDAALLARDVDGQPVKVVWSRADEFRCSPLAPGMVTKVTATLNSEQKIIGMEVMANSAPHGNRPGRSGSPNLRAAAYLDHPFIPAKSADVPLANGGGADRNAVPLYAIENLNISKRVVHNLPYRTSSMRGLGAFLNVYAIETLMDQIAFEVGEDPFDFRIRHLADPRACDVIERVREMAKKIITASTQEGVGWGLGFAKYKNTAAYCAIVVRVEVIETVHVSHVYAVVDTGEVINPDGAINQTEGGILQSMSWTLKESIKFDGPSVSTENWLDYPILKFSELPEVHVSLIDRPECPPLGCAEAAQGPIAAAIGNAVFNAIGVSVPNLPLTKDALLKAALQD